jgi:thiol-disulfide isomerase/thioredoxin
MSHKNTDICLHLNHHMPGKQSQKYETWFVGVGSTDHCPLRLAFLAAAIRGGEDSPSNDDTDDDDTDNGKILHPTTIEELEEILSDASSTSEGGHQKLVVIDFYADNCPPCEKVAPLVQELSHEFRDKAVFVKVHAQKSPDIASKYNVTGWPTFLFVMNGQVLTEIVGGSLAEATLYEWVKLFTSKKGTTKNED